TAPDVAGQPSQVDVFLNSFGVGRRLVNFSPLGDNTVIQSAVLTAVNADAFPDLILSVKTPSTTANSRASNVDNLFVMFGNGDGTFQAPLPYLAADTDLSTLPQPSFLGLVSNPFIKATTFTVSGQL